MNALYAFAEHDAIGFSPFAIESATGPTAAALLASSNDLVAQLTPLILEHQGRGTMAGMLQEHPDNRQPQQIRLNGYVLRRPSSARLRRRSRKGRVIDPAGAVGAAGLARGRPRHRDGARTNSCSPAWA